MLTQQSFDCLHRHSELGEPSARALKDFEFACKQLQNMEVNSAILKATGAGKTLRHLVKAGASEEQRAVACLTKQVIESWKQRIVRE